MKKIVIIGGGIAGLTAGIYAQKAGFKSVILEKHAISGGECTGWDRNGYHIDGCIHWLTGTDPDNDMYKVWQEVGALENTEIIQLDHFSVWEHHGQTFTIWKDIDKLRDEMLRLAPEDATQIAEFIGAIKDLGVMGIPAKKPMEMMHVFDYMAMVKMAKVGKAMMKYSPMTCAEYAANYKSPILADFFAYSMRANFSISSLLFSIAIFCSGNGAIPKGGSRAMAKRMEQKYLSLGGEVKYNCSAEKIVTQNGIATNVLCANGEEYTGDYIIPACDVHITFGKLLDKQYECEEYTTRDSDPYTYPLPSCVYIGLGIADEMKGFPHSITFDCEPYIAGTTTLTKAGFKTYTHEKSFAPIGHTACVSYIDQDSNDCDHWLKLYTDKQAYNAKKYELANNVVEKIVKRFPELQDKITVLDVATPATYHRYTGAYKGAWMAYMFTPKGKPVSHKGRIPGLDNVVLASQWLEYSGGLPTAALSGKFAIQRILKKESKSIKI